MTQNGKEYGLFVKENCKEGDLIIEYVGKLLQQKNNQQHILHEYK
jgi:SET domain-containing protein